MLQYLVRMLGNNALLWACVLWFITISKELIHVMTWCKLWKCKLWKWDLGTRLWVRLLEVQLTIFVFCGDGYTLDSQPWLYMGLCEIFRMLNMSSHCWGHLNTPLDNTSTNTQHVESLYSGQIQCICTRLLINGLPLSDEIFNLRMIQ